MAKSQRGSSRTVPVPQVAFRLLRIAAAAAFLVKENGSFFMVHRPRRLQEIFEAFAACRLTACRARLVYPAADKAPEMILLEARKNRAKELKFEPPLIMYEGRDYTKEFLEYVSD